jgi:two-component system nitrogen regulation sensor histidine kinase NtrY
VLKKGIKLYWLLFAAGLFLLVVFAFFERLMVKNAPQQIESAYEQVQQVVRSKELSFVRLIQSDLLTDTNNLQRNWNNIHKTLQQENVDVFVTKNDTLWYWSSNKFDLADFTADEKNNHTCIKTGNGWYITYVHKRGTYTYHFSYLIKNNFAYKNQYLQNQFNRELSFLQDAIVVNQHINDKYHDIYSINGAYLFSIQIFGVAANTNWFIKACIILLILYSILLIHAIVRYYIRIYPNITTAIFFSFFIWIRFITTFYNIPAFIYNNKLFSAGVYASSIWFPSLGDLLIDSAIFLWYFILLEHRKNHIRIKKQHSHVGEMILYGVLSIFSANAVFSSIKSLAIDSQISFDITQIYSINAFTYFAIMVCVIQLLVVYFISRNFTRAINKSTGHFLIPIIISTAIALLYLLIANKIFEHDIFRYWSVMIVASAFIIFKLLTPKLNRFQQYFFVIVVISLYSAISIWHWQNVRERDNRKLFAVKQISQNDITNDYFLRGIDRKLKQDKYLSEYYLSPFIIKTQFEKQIRQLYFTGYLSKFDVQLFDYDSAGNHFKEKNELSYWQAQKLYDQQRAETYAGSFRYMQNSGEIKGYIGKFIIRKGRSVLGYLFVLLKPKLIQNENRFDEILMEGISASRQKTNEYSYAVYKDKKLVYQSGDYAYSIINTWGGNEWEFRFFEENNYSHLLYTDAQPLTVAVSKPANNINQVVGLFSFIFTCCTIVLILVLLLFMVLNTQLLKRLSVGENSVTRWIRNSLLKLLMMEHHQIILIRTRIQSSIVFIVFISLVFSSYFTIQFTTDKYNLRQTDRLMKKLKSIVMNVQNERIISRPYFNSNEIEAFINQIADFYDTDINLFNIKGKLIASSTGKLYDEHIISKRMHPLAYFHLTYLRESQYSQNEKIGSLTFQTAYAPIFNSRNEVIGYLQLPYFSKQFDLIGEISSVVIGFINLYVLLFIIIVLIAYLVSRNISYPLTLIQQNLAKMALGKSNEPIVWKRDDEIGELVKQYNSMIMQLDESARKLAETERQGAWREIARQIAHEIKNPLTPMKLSIQHLQRAYANQDANIGDKIKRTSELLITQIEVLSELANEFSSFAKMPTPSYEEINVYQSLRQLVDLYSQGNEHNIQLHCNKHISIQFDSGYFNRIMTNLLKNAIQAMPENKQGEILIDVIDGNEVVRIYVKDNGTGMSEEQAANIFVPYFSTKISGMGLGLPIVKNMIESGGGSISFTTQQSVGTEFCITLPKQQTE